MPTPLNDSKLLLILAPLVFSFAFALDIYVPVVPSLVKTFDTTPFMVQLTLSLFMFTMGVGQLLMGPLSDSLGRRKIVLSATSLFTAGSLFSACAHSIESLILGRIICAAGGCGMMVSGFAIIRDSFDDNKAGQMMSLLNASIAISPVFAPIIGGYLATWFDWRAPIIFLVFVGSYALVLNYFFLPETLSVERRLPLDKNLPRRYWALLANPKFSFNGLCVCVAMTCFFLFFSVSSYILIEDLHIALDHFGYYFALMGVMFFVGSLLCAKFIDRYGLAKTRDVALLVVFLGAVLMTVWHFALGLSAAGFLVPMIAIGLGAACLMGSGTGSALAPYQNMAGTASALLGCLQFLFAASVGTIVMRWEILSTLPMALAVLIMSSTLVVIRHCKQKASWAN